MAEKTPDTQIILTAQTQSLTTRGLNSSGSKVFLLQDGFILANDLLNEWEQLLTDILGYYSENGHWPTVAILPPNDEKDDDNRK